MKYLNLPWEQRSSFLGMVGIVLSAIANTDIPNLTPGHDEESNKLDEEKNSRE